MEQNYSWLATSLFCRKSNWGKLLAEIDFFLNKWSENRLSTYLLEFNYLSGENIRFALLAPAELADFFAKQLDKYFKDAFLRSGLSINSAIPAADSIFMPFPENTIQYGLYVPDDIYELNKYSFAPKLSELMLEGLKKEEIDDDLIITFGLYLTLVFVKVFIKDRPQLVAELLNFYTSSDNERNVGLERTQFANNIEILSGIIIDIFGFYQESNAPGWLQKWSEVCKSLIAANLLHYPGDNLMIIYTKVIYRIYRHIGLNSEMELLLACLIRQALEYVALQDKNRADITRGI